jgi:hypothetical protein
MDAEQFRKAGYQAIDQSPRPFNPHLILVIAYFDTIGSRPVLPSVQPGFMRQQLPTSIPLEPQEWDKIQPDIEKLIMVRTTSLFFTFLGTLHLPRLILVLSFLLGLLSSFSVSCFFSLCTWGAFIFIFLES